MPDKQKLVKVPDLGIIAFPDSMPDSNIAAVIKTFRDSDKQKKQTHTKSAHVSGVTTEQSEHARQIGNVPSVSPDWNTLRQAVYKATEPTLENPNTTPVDTSFGANRDAAWNAGVNALNVGGNIAKRTSRMIFGVVDMVPQVASILRDIGSSDDKVSQSAEDRLLALHPGAQMADYVKQTAQDWRKSKSLAAENVLGDAIGFFLLDRAGGKLADARLKTLEANGVVLPPEAKPQTPAPAGAQPPTIEGQFTPASPQQIAPVEAAAHMKRVTPPPSLSEVKSEAAKLAPQETALTAPSNAVRPSYKEPDPTTAEIVFSGNQSPNRLYRGTNGEDELRNLLSSGSVASTSETSSRLDKPQHAGMTFFSDRPNVATSYVHDNGYVIELDASKVAGVSGQGAGEIATSEKTPLDAITRVFKIGKDARGYHATDVTGRFLPKGAPIDAQMNLKYTGAQGAQPFYLKSERILADKMKGPMPASDIQKMLLANGVKEEEMKYTGLSELLHEKGKEPVHPEELKKFLDANNLQIREVTYGGSNPEASNINEWKNAPTKFGSYTLPGGQNYQEKLLTLPEREMPRIPLIETYQRRLNDSNLDPEIRRSTQQEIDRIRRQTLNPQTFRTSHWPDIANPVGHVRFNDRVGPNGEKLLHLEELQSDWGQKIRREKGEGTTPDMPFKKTWPELLMKRMIRYAAENGYDGISWTPGEEQAARYDLSKQVDEIRAYKHEDGTYSVAATKDAGRGTADVLMDKTGVKESELPDLIGKELANKIVQQPVGPEKSYRGLDLKVGGEGMKGFYDKIVPEMANKLGKQFGAKVGETTIRPTYVKPGSFTEEFLGRKPDKKVPYLPITPEMRAGVKAEPFALFKLLYKPHPASEVETARQWMALGDVNRELNKIGPAPLNWESSPEQRAKLQGAQKEWEAQAGPWLDKYRQITQNIENLRNQGDLGQIRILPDKQRVLYLNRAGLNALYHAIANQPSPEHTLGGVSLSPPYVKAVVSNLMTRKPPMWQEVMNLILRAMDKNGVVISAIPEKGQSLSEALAILREELNHGWQKVFADAAGNHLPPEKFAELNQSIPQAMSDHLRQNYPEISNDGSEIMNRRRVLEASAKMLSEAPVKFGLTEDEWAAYLFQYFHAVEETHGAKALEQLLHITSLAKEVKNDYFKATGREPGSQEGGRGVPSLQETGPQGPEGTSPPAGRGVQAGADTSHDLTNPNVTTKLTRADKSRPVPEIEKLKEEARSLNPQKSDSWKPSDIEYWGKHYQHSFKTEKEARDFVFDRLEYNDRQAWADLFGKNGPEKNRALADSVPLRRERGGRYRIGTKPKPEPARTDRLGTERPDGDAPSVNWTARDNQDSGSVSEESIIRDYNDGKPALVYRSYISSEDMPEYRLAEQQDMNDDEDEEGGYDWDSLRMTGHRRTTPPMKVRIKKSGKIEIIDGNHRLKLWQDRGYSSYPAWVIDERKTKLTGLSEDEEDRLTALKRDARALNPAHVRVRDPEGYTHTFPDQQSAERFKTEAGIVP